MTLNFDGGGTSEFMHYSYSASFYGSTHLKPRDLMSTYIVHTSSCTIMTQGETLLYNSDSVLTFHGYTLPPSSYTGLQYIRYIITWRQSPVVRCSSDALTTLISSCNKVLNKRLKVRKCVEPPTQLLHCFGVTKSWYRYSYTIFTAGILTSASVETQPVY